MDHTTGVQDAARRLAEMLKSPQDLGKVPMIRKRVAQEKASIDAKLKTGVKEQLDTVQVGLNKLRDSRRDMLDIRESMVSVDRLCSDSQNQVKAFNKIYQISVVHRNFTTTESMIQNMRKIYSNLDRIEKAVEEGRDHLYGPAQGLLPAHFLLKQVEQFRDEATDQASRADFDTQSIVKQYLSRLDSIQQLFESYLWELARNSMEIVRAGHGAVLVKLMKIIHVENKADEKATMVKNAKALQPDLAGKFRSVAVSTEVKGWGSKLIHAIEESTLEIFDLCWDKYKDDPSKLLATTNWVYDDLKLVKEEMVKLFPQSFNAYHVYAKAYHKGMYKMVNQLVESNPGASIFLELNTFIKQYKKKMIGELAIPEKVLAPPLLDGKETSLVDDYLRLLVQKLDEWVANLMHTETGEFVKREAAPERDTDGLYGLQGTVIMFQMINQQVDLALDSNLGSILAKVVDECKRVMVETQSSWTRLLDTELSKNSKAPAEAIGGLVEYTVALANDQIRSADFAEVLITRLEPLVSEKYSQPISTSLTAAMDGHLEVAKKATSVLVELIFIDVRPALKTLFTSLWYQQNQMGNVSISATFGDYLSDFKGTLNPNLFELVVEDLLEQWVVIYLAHLRRVGPSKLRMHDAIELIRSDVRSAFTLFASYRTQEDLVLFFDPIDKVLALLSAGKKTAFLDGISLLRAYPDCGTKYLEDSFRIRDDLSKADVSEIMSEIKRKLSASEDASLLRTEPATTSLPSAASSSVPPPAPLSILAKVASMSL